MRRKGKAVNGVVAPGPRFTWWAAYYVVVYLVIPIVGLGLVLDVALYFVMREVGRCYGVLCLFS
ncbi:MAG: hypothetical protein FJX65_11620 [Alphaproteobacteria bacterium]|nr:hypothetical protein [Alphaproteobacteria bacterium]